MGWKDNFKHAFDLFVDRMVELRNEKGLTQRDLALKSGLTRRMIGGYERKETQPTLISLHAIAAGLGIDVAELFPLEGKLWVDEEKLEEVEEAIDSVQTSLDHLKDVLQTTRRRARNRLNGGD